MITVVQCTNSVVKAKYIVIKNFICRVMNECCTRGYVHRLSLNLPSAALVNHSAPATAVVLE